MIERQGEVFDIGYQRYEGPRQGRWRSRFALFDNGVRSVLGIGRGGRAKVLPILLFIAAMLPAVIFVLVVSATGLDANFVPGPADYYEIVSIVLLVFAAIMAPELLIPDRRDRVLDLYLVRPLTTSDYLIARLAAFFVIILALVYSGQFVLQIGLLLVSADPLAYIRQNWAEVPRFLASGIFIALFITILPMTIAAFVSRRAFATAIVIGLWFISTAFVSGLATGDCSQRAVPGPDGQPRFEVVCEPLIGDTIRWVSLLDVGSVPLHLNVMIFDRVPSPMDGNPSLAYAAQLPPIVPIAWYLLCVGVPSLLLWNRYRRSAL